MQENLVSFDVAKGAANAGFNLLSGKDAILVSVRNKYTKNDYSATRVINSGEEYYHAPSQAMLADWLRKKDIHAEVIYDRLKDCYNYLITYKYKERWGDTSKYPNSKSHQEAFDLALLEAISYIGL